jgi:UDP-glucuronate 4-epimerase
MVPAAPILVTGAAGFIGYHVAHRLLREGHTVLGLDNLNAYYDPALKEARLAEVAKHPNFRFARLDLADREGIAALFARNRFAHVIHLGAQVGVRYSLVDPHAYVQSNLVGFVNILEGCRHNGCRHLLYASSSSVFGANTHLPFSVHDNVDHPLNLYGATKKSNELLAHSYSHLFGLPTTGLRFFTVYGPWGRPDMAMWLFADAIIAGRPIKLFNHGRMWRDFTYVDDVVESIVRLVDHTPRPDTDWTGDKPDPASSAAPWRVYNIGNHSPVELLEVVRLLEEAIGTRARCEFLPMQAGDALATHADVEDLAREVDFKPAMPLADGIARFVHWFQAYHAVTRRPSALVDGAGLLGPGGHHQSIIAAVAHSDGAEAPLSATPAPGFIAA